MKEELLRFNKKQKYMVFDYETCNLNLVSVENKPWQLAYIVFQGDKVLEEKDYLLSWENLNVSKEAARITGFSKSKYNKNKVCPKKVMDKFSKSINTEYKETQNAPQPKAQLSANTTTLPKKQDSSSKLSYADDPIVASMLSKAEQRQIKNQLLASSILSEAVERDIIRNKDVNALHLDG